MLSGCWQIIDRNWTQYCSDEARFDNSKNETPSRSTADDLQTGWTLNLIDAIYGSVGSSQSRPELKTRISVQFRCTVGVMSVGGPLDSFYIAWLVTIRDKITRYFHSRLTGWIRSTILAFIDRPPAKRRGFRSCLSLCLSDDNFRKLWHRKFIFAHPVYLEGIRVKFVYGGYRVKVKITEAKRLKIPGNVKLR